MSPLGPGTTLWEFQLAVPSLACGSKIGPLSIRSCLQHSEHGCPPLAGALPPTPGRWGGRAGQLLHRQPAAGCCAGCKHSGYQWLASHLGCGPQRHWRLCHSGFHAWDRCASGRVRICDTRALVTRSSDSRVAATTGLFAAANNPIAAAAAQSAAACLHA